jgi:hypothetical protein
MNRNALHDLIIDIHALDRELQRYEEKYSLLSGDFYELYTGGQLRDEEIQEIDEYGRWAALYQMRGRREAQYKKAKASLFNVGATANGITLVPYVTSNLR